MAKILPMKSSPILLPIQKIDRNIMLAITKWHNSVLTFFLKIITHSGRGFSWMVVTAILYFLNSNDIIIIPDQRIFFKALLCPFTAFMIGNLIKLVVKRKRPYEGMKNYTSLVGAPIGGSFPSLHTATSFALLMALILLHHPWAPWVGAWALLVSFSRIYMGVHYLSDVIAGLFLGIFCGGLIVHLIS